MYLCKNNPCTHSEKEHPACNTGRGVDVYISLDSTGKGYGEGDRGGFIVSVMDATETQVEKAVEALPCRYYRVEFSARNIRIMRGTR